MHTVLQRRGSSGAGLLCYRFIQIAPERSSTGSEQALQTLHDRFTRRIRSMGLCLPCRDCQSCPVCASEAHRKEPFLEQHAWPFALPRCGRRTYTPQLSAYAGRSQDHRSRLPAEAVLGSECDGSSLDRIERVPWTRICDDRRLCKPRPAAVGRVNASRMYVIPHAQLIA